MGVTGHALQRVSERCREAGVDPVPVVAKAITQARRTRDGESVAVRCAVLPSQVGKAWSDRSNGDVVWAIVRDGRIITAMLRRSTQPATSQALRVDRIVLAG